MTEKIKRYRAASVQLRQTEGEEPRRTIEGYAIVFGEESRDVWGNGINEIIEPGAVTREALDKCDIKMTLYHDNSRLLARSKFGTGSLAYEVDDHGVKFSFDAPRTADGDAALELVRTGVIDGCSFAFGIDIKDRTAAAITESTVHIKRIDSIYDFTLTPDPAYEATEVSARDVFGDNPEAVKKNLRRQKMAAAIRASVK